VVLAFTLYILTVPLGIAAFFWMPETKGERRSGTRAYLGDILRLTRHPRLLVAFSAGFLRFFLDYGFLTYFPLFLVRTHGISTATAGLLYTFFSAGAMITSSQAGRLAAGRDKAHLLFVAFLISGAAVIAVPLIPGVWLVGSALFFYGLANGVISPNAEEFVDPKRAGGIYAAGIVSFDRPDSAGFKDDLDIHRRHPAGICKSADDFLVSGRSFSHQCAFNGSPVAERQTTSHQARS